MKKYEGKEVEILVEPFSDSKSHYAIYYREKKKFKIFNLFNFWNRYEYTFRSSIDNFDCYQPYLFKSFDSALVSAETLKNNPKLIDKNNYKRLCDYNKYRKEYEEYYKERNRSKII